MANNLLTTTTATALLVLTLSNFLLPALSCPACPVCPHQSPPHHKHKSRPRPPPPAAQRPPPPRAPKPPPSPPTSPTPPPTPPPPPPPPPESTTPSPTTPTTPLPPTTPTSPTTPTPDEECPINVLKLDGCVDVLNGLLHVVLGGSSAKEECCPMLAGLTGVDAGLCLCTAIRAKLLSVDLLLPVVLDVLVDCGKRLPADYTCPSTS